MLAGIRHALYTLAIAALGLVLLPVWAVTSLLAGRDTVQWLEEYIERRRRK